MKKVSKLVVVGVLIAMFTLTIGTVIFAANTDNTGVDSNVLVQLNNAKINKAQADAEGTYYRNALKSMQTNYWIAFLVLLSLTFMGVMMTIHFVQSRKKLATVKTQNIQE